MRKAPGEVVCGDMVAVGGANWGGKKEGRGGKVVVVVVGRRGVCDGGSTVLGGASSHWAK